MFSNEQIKKIMGKTKALPDNEFDKLEKEAKNAGKKVESYLYEKKIITPLALYENAASYFKIPFINLKGHVIRKDILMIIPEPIASTHKLIAFEKNDKEIKIATKNPEKL